MIRLTSLIWQQQINMEHVMSHKSLSLCLSIVSYFKILKGEAKE